MYKSADRPAVRRLTALALAAALSAGAHSQLPTQRDGNRLAETPGAPLAAGGGSCPTCPTTPGATLLVGVDGTLGCQGPSGTQPLLSSGGIANGRMEFTYNNLPTLPGLGLLTLCVTNDTPAANTPGELDPVITQIAFNLPAGLVTTAGLANQCTNGSGQSSFLLIADTFAYPQPRLGCFGQFNILLTADKNRGALGSGDPNAVFGVSNVTTGTVRFDILLIGAGVDSLSAGLIAFGLSIGGSKAAVNGAMVFEAGLNPMGIENGALSARDGNALNPGTTAPTVSVPAPVVFASRPAQPPTKVVLNLTGDPGFHPCLLVSAFSGNTIFPGITSPIPLGSGMTNEVIGFPVGQPFPSSGKLQFELPVPVTSAILQALQLGSGCPPPQNLGEECLFLCVVAVPPGPGPQPQPDLDAPVSPRFDMRVRLRPIE